MSSTQRDPTIGADPPPAVGRPRKYTQESILDAALDVARRTGLDKLTMHEVAAALGASPATLYRYVDNRESLVRATADRLATQFRIPQPTSASASAQQRREWLTELAMLTRDQLLRVRGAADYLLVNGPTGPAGLKYMENVCDVIAQTGRSPKQVAHAYDLLLTTVVAYTIKIERLEVGNQRRATSASVLALHDTIGGSALVGEVLREITQEDDGSFQQAIAQVVEAITRPSATKQPS